MPVRWITLAALTYTDDLVGAFAEIARQAGTIALSYFRPGAMTHAEIKQKCGGSPVTEADYLVDRFLKQKLETLVPDAGWLSEETEDSPERLDKRRVLIVDPIDGTRGFSQGDARWAIAMALVEDRRPVLAAIHAPALGETYLAIEGQGARLNDRPISVSHRLKMDPGARIAAPVPLAEELRRAGLPFTLEPKIPSLAMRIAKVASGVLDAGFATENAHDWDIAAADLILHEAGGRLASLEGTPLLYNRPETRHGLLTAAPTQIHAEVNAAARRVRGRAPIGAADTPEKQ